MLGAALGTVKHYNGGSIKDSSDKCHHFRNPLHICEKPSNHYTFVSSNPVPNTQYPEPRTQYSVPSTQYPVPRTQYSVPNTQNPILSTQYSVPSTQYPEPNTQYPVPNTQNPILSTQYPVPRTHMASIMWMVLYFRLLNMLHNNVFIWYFLRCPYLVCSTLFRENFFI